MLYELASGGGLDGLGDNTAQAIRVVDEALDQLSLIEGRVDGFANYTVDSSATVLDEFTTTLTDTIDALSAVDEEAETLLLAKNQALASNTISAMSVLQQQQQNIILLIEQIAGFY